MFVGTVIIALAMVINVVPLYLDGGPRAIGPFGIPIGSLFVVGTVALVAVGELFAQSRVFEYIPARSLRRGGRGSSSGTRTCRRRSGRSRAGRWGRTSFTT